MAPVPERRVRRLSDGILEESQLLRGEQQQGWQVGARAHLLHARSAAVRGAAHHRRPGPSLEVPASQSHASAARGPPVHGPHSEPLPRQQPQRAHAAAAAAPPREHGVRRKRTPADGPPAEQPVRARLALRGLLAVRGHAAAVLRGGGGPAGKQRRGDAVVPRPPAQV